MSADDPRLSEVQAALNKTLETYPALRGPDYNIIDSRGREGARGQLEFYPPDEKYNPTPGRPTIEVFNPELKDRRLSEAIFGDLLHYAPEQVPGWAPMRQMFMRTITPEQALVDRGAYERARTEGENRSLRDWFLRSRLDAYIRGKLAPDQQNEWAGAYTPTQEELLMKMRGLLK